VAKEKITGKRIKSLSKNYEYTGTDKFWWDGDYLHMVAEESEWKNKYSDPSVYNNLTNTWAEILPSKKTLPKTKEEFKQFLHEWDPFSTSINDYLNLYE